MNQSAPGFCFSGFLLFILWGFSPVCGQTAGSATDVVPLDLPVNASAQQISAFAGFPEPLRPVGDPSQDPATAALGLAINAWLKSTTPDDFSPLETFVTQYPQSSWTPGLAYNLGQLYYGTGYFSRAIAAYETVWNTCRDRQEPAAVQFGHQAVAELSTMYARVGRKKELAALLAEIKGETLTDNARVQRDRAAEGLSGMNSQPGVSFRCGTHALGNVCRKLNRPVPKNFMDSEPSTEKGFSLSQLKVIAQKRLDLPMKIVRHAVGAPIQVPSVIHLKCGHYGALVESANDHFLLMDPTFGNDTWVTRKAIEDEGSGYFLVPSESVPEGTPEVTREVADTIRGRGNVGSSNPKSTTTADQKCATGHCPPPGMAGYNFLTMLVSLSVTDTPIVIPTAYGPGLSLTVTYNQSEANQAATKLYTHFSPQWVSNLVSFLVDDTTSDGASVTIYLPGGGSETHSGYTPAGPISAHQGHYTIQSTSGTVLYRMSAGQYERRNPDGSKLVYSRDIGTTGTARQVFLTQIVDAWGNPMVLNYDSNYTARIASVKNASGQYLYFFYGNASDSYLTTGVADNLVWTQAFKKVSFAYQTTAGAQRLTSITDPVGIVSAFAYDATGFMNSLTTPYGTTTFAAGSQTVGADLSRWLESTDANGDKEHLEFHSSLDTSSIPINPMPSGTGFTQAASLMNYRNSFYWDKKAWHDAPGDITKAHLSHWLHTSDGSNSSSGTVECEKSALENFIWNDYPGQAGFSNVEGTMSTPSVVARAIEGPTGATLSALAYYTYNSLTGNMTQSTDADGHVMGYTYDATGYDLQSVQAQDGANWHTLATYANYLNHQPQTMTDASGVSTTYSYNSKGQVVQMVVTSGTTTLTTKYTYDQVDPVNGSLTCGFLLRTDHNSAGNPAQFVTLGSATYDTFGRPLTSTDSQGYTRTFAFDALDRLTLVTHPDGTTEQTGYTQNGHMIIQPTSTKDRAGHLTQMRYNALGQLAESIDPALQTTGYTWCRCGAMSTLTDPMGKVTFWKRDVEGRVSYKLLSDGKRYNYGYQPLSGRLATVAFPADADAGRTTYTNYYSLGGRLMKKDFTDPAMADVSFVYNDFMGRLTSMTDGLGTTNYTYVPLDGASAGAGQLSTVNGPFSNDTLRYSYDSLGRRFKNEVLNDDGATVTRSEQILAFDGLGRIAQTVNNLGTFTPTYNPANLTGVPDSVSLPGGITTNITRYAANTGANALRLQTLEHRTGGNSVWQSHSFAYDLAGNISTWTMSTRRWDLQYDALGELTSLNSTLTVNNTPEEARTWQYDTSGNMISDTYAPQGQAARLELRQHAGRNQLVSVGGAGSTMVQGTVNKPSTVNVNGQPARVSSLGASGQWQFQKQMDFPLGSTTLNIDATDGNGNVGRKSYTVTVGNDETRTLDYDTNGNLLHKLWLHTGTAYRKETYTWDVENRLLSWENRQLASGGQPDLVLATAAWVYDGLGRRVKEHNVNGSAAQDKNIVWDGMTMVQWQNSDGSVQKNLFAQGEQTTASGESLIYITDHLGSVRGWQRLSDGAQGLADYSAYGMRTITSNATGVPVKSYTGHYQHEASGLILAPYRAFDPDLGRWLSEDPIAEQGGINLYAYVGNGPILRVDPFGLTDGQGGDPTFDKKLNSASPEEIQKDAQNFRNQIDKLNKKIAENPGDSRTGSWQKNIDLMKQRLNKIAEKCPSGEPSSPVSPSVWQRFLQGLENFPLILIGPQWQFDPNLNPNMDTST